MRFLSLIFSLICIALLVGAFFLFWGFENYLSSYLTSHLGTPTAIEKVRLSTDQVRLKGFTLKSRGGALQKAFFADELVFKAPVTNYLKRKVHLKAVRIENCEIGLEFFNSSGSSNNWVQILRDFPLDNRSNRRYVIDRLVFSNIQLHIVKSNGKRIPLPEIPHLEFRNLGSEKGMSCAEIGRVIFQSLMTYLTRQASLSKILNNVQDLPHNFLQEIPIEDRGEAIDEVKRRARGILREIISG